MSIRSRLGYNNNPTALQFKTAYKKLLIRAEIRSNGIGNCIPLEDIPVLCVSSTVQKINSSVSRRFEYISTTDIDVPEDLELSKFCEYTMDYIAGFIVFRIIKEVNCIVCQNALYGDENNFKQSLIFLKTRGGLCYPSESVVAVVKFSEKVFKSIKDFNDKKLVIKFRSLVLTEFIGSNVFSDIEGHMFDTVPTQNHVVLLIQLIAETFLSVRLNHYYRLKASKDRIRQKLTKLIIFKGQ